MRGESQAVTIGHVEAVQIAINNSAVIEFDETAQSPYFTYEKTMYGMRYGLRM